MPFQQKSIAAMLFIILSVYGWYFVHIIGQAAQRGAEQVEYKLLLIGVIAVMTVLAIIAHVLIAAGKPSEAGEQDERDQSIALRSSRIAGIVLFISTFSVLGLVMNGLEHFWIAQALIASLALSDIVLRVSMLVYYHRGA